MERAAIRYGEYLRRTSIDTVRISFSDLTRLRRDAPPRRLALGRRDYQRLFVPYFSERSGEQLRAVLPLALYLAAFQILILRQNVADPWSVVAGLLAVVLGLMLFLEGLRVGLMPFGEAIGHALPVRSPLPMVMAVAFVLGIGVTFAEPAIGALQAAGALVVPEKAPYLYALLTAWAFPLVLVVGIGVGLAAVIGTLRFLYGWSLKPLILASVALSLLLSLWVAFDAELSSILALAWDCGAVTTGPVTVPLVLALGIGVAASGGRGESSLSGFGIVTLASLFPVIAVLLLGIYVQATEPVALVLERAAAATVGTAAPAWHETTPWLETIGGVRAIVPLVVFLLLVARFVARADLREPAMLAFGILLSLAGMILFSVGLTYGLAALGAQSGATIPGAFLQVIGPEGWPVPGTPYYGYAMGILVTLIFAFLLGFGATVAEPALNALGVTVESLTNGALRRVVLVAAVSVGVAAGIAVGVAKLIFGWPLIWLVVPGYLIAVALTLVSSEEYVNVAWDSAGVTTGPVTVPLVLALGLGLGGGVEAVEGFGILAMASIGPIISVLCVGLIVRLRTRRRAAQAAGGPGGRSP